MNAKGPTPIGSLDPASQQTYMRKAIEICRRGIETGQSPFGACVVTPSDDVFAAHNTVWKARECTAHAEINAIREACTTLGTVHLDGCWLFSTTEPCPMCAAAAHWARIHTVVYGASIDDAVAAGFHELLVPAKDLLGQGRSETRIIPGILRDECRALFDEWKRADRCPAY